MTGPSLNPSPWNRAASWPVPTGPMQPQPFSMPFPPPVLPVQPPAVTLSPLPQAPPFADSFEGSQKLSLKNWQPDPSLVRTRELQERFPGMKARLIHSIPFDQALPNAMTTLGTLNKVRNHDRATDQELGLLDDQSKRLASLGIAVLATWGLKQRIFGVGEFLGFLSWYFAMGATPRVINAMVQLKTGVNLDRLYMSNDGKRQNLYRDPNYLPLHLLPDSEINRAAKRMGVPQDDPDKRKKVEEQIRRVSVQAHTWWMLVAGPATPILSGAVCDQLQDPATKLVNKVKLAWAKRGIQSAEGEKLAGKTQAYLNQLLGEPSESRLSMWWKKFRTDMIKMTALHKGVSTKDVTQAPREALLSKVVDHFANLQPASEKVSASLRYLEQQQAYLSRLKTEAFDFLEPLKDKLDEKTFNARKELIESRIANAESTGHHLGKLFQAIEKGTEDRAEIRRLIEEKVLGVAQRLMESGAAPEKVREIAGSPEMAARLGNALGNLQFGPAFKLMGASPEAHLLTGLKDTMLRKLWQRRVLGYGGLGLLGATLLYTLFVVGRPFNDKPKGMTRA